MKLILIVLLMFSLSGCSLFQTKSEPVVIENRTASIPVFHPPLPDGVVLGDIKWKVLTPDIMAEYLKDLKAGNAPVNVYYGLTPKAYEILATNISDLKRYIIHQQSIIRYYRKNLKFTAPQ